MASPAPASPEPALKDVAGSIYGPIIAAQLDQERARKSSIDTRCAAVVTSSGVLLGLFTGLLTLIEGKDFHPPLGLLIPLALAYALFVGAGVAAIAASAYGNTIEGFGEVRVPNLRAWVAGWTSPASASAGLQVANELLNLLSVLRGKNLKKWRILLGAVIAEIGAVIAFVAILFTQIVR